MGTKMSKMGLSGEERDLQQLRECLTNLLLQISPEELLTFVLEDKEICDACRANEELRQACILACVRKYHREKFFFEEVHNRKANFMILLDEFRQIQDEYEMKEFMPKKSWLPWKNRPLKDREGDAAANGETSNEKK